MARLTEYDDAAKARGLAVLRANGGNAKKTARELGVPRSTLRAWAGLRENEGKRAADVPATVVNDAVADLARKWLETAHRAVDLANELLERKESRGVKDLLVGAAVATEKHQLLVGGPTSRTESLRVSLVAPDALRSDTLRIIEGGKRTA